jgi:septum site-determining protein MinC
VNKQTGATGGIAKGACELKSAQFSLIRLAIYQTDSNAIQSFVADQVYAAPELLEDAPVALDFSACGHAVDFELIEDLISRLRYAGVQPVALVAETNTAHAAIAKQLRLGVLAPLKRSGKVEHSAKNVGVVTMPASPTPVAELTAAVTPKPDPIAARETLPVPNAAGASQKSGRDERSQRSAEAAPLPVQRYDGQVRSGQQLYAKGRDLIVTGVAGASSEVISDGSIHVYGRLMGKVIAGASGDRDARIYCLAFGAELVSIAGVFRVFESIPRDLAGKSVQIWLDGDKLRFDTLN